MGALCSTNSVEEPKTCKVFKPIRLECKGSGSYGCFSQFTSESYDDLMQYALNNQDRITVQNEHNKFVKIMDVVYWLNPDNKGGAYKYIKPNIKEDYILDVSLSSNKTFKFNNYYIDKESYTKTVIDEKNGAKYIAESYKFDYGKVEENTTYRPLQNGCVFTISLPPNQTFTLLNIKLVVDENQNPVINYNVEMQNITIIMNEMCSDGDLFDYARKSKVDITKLMSDITPFMKTIHTNNVTHLDIKPENIFMCNGRYKIADYGGVKKNRKKYSGDTFTLMLPTFLKFTRSYFDVLNYNLMEYMMPQFTTHNSIYGTNNITNIKTYFRNLFYYIKEKETYGGYTYEHAKFVDRYALALSLLMIMKYQERLGLVSVSDKNVVQTYVRELLDFTKPGYFENSKTEGGASNKIQITINKKRILRVVHHCAQGRYVICDKKKYFLNK
jgi:hypothetical protein